MITGILIGTAVYIIACYFFIGRWITKSPGPAGLGILFIPFAPLMPPMLVGMAIKSFFRKIFS